MKGVLTSPTALLNVLVQDVGQLRRQASDTHRHMGTLRTDMDTMRADIAAIRAAVAPREPLPGG